MTTTRFKAPEITLSWMGDSTEERAPIFRDADAQLIEPLVDFCDHILSRFRRVTPEPKAYNAQLESLTYAMKNFAQFLAEKSVDWRSERSIFDIDTLRKPTLHWLDVSDDYLLQYRDWALKKVMGNRISRHSKRKAMNTTNIKLRWVYELYCWAQVDAKIAPNLIGWDETNQIRSSLPAVLATNNPLDAKATAKYPLCFQRIGSTSRTNEAQHWASQDEILLLERYFLETCTPLVAVRNVLILHLGEHVGWRCESVNSLTIDLFSDTAISAQEASGRADFLVTPPKQKNGHTFSFPVPWELTYRIQAYIKGRHGGRAQLLDTLGVGEKVTDGRVFVSARGGTPLTDRALSQLFGKGFKAIGAPKGTGYHAVRRGMMDNFGDQSLEARREAGLSTAKEDVLQDFMDKLGHSTGSSLRAYLRATRRRKSLTTVERQQRELVASEAQNAQSRMETAMLRELLEQRDARERTSQSASQKRRK